MNAVVFAVPGCEAAAERVRARIGAESGVAVVRSFPDGELYVRIDSAVQGRTVVIVGSLDRPGDKILPLWFLASTARDLGAARVGLVAPYLAFMRQDSRFHPGEGVTAAYFARLVAAAADWLVTVDPHLHRVGSLDGLYPIPTKLVHSAQAIAGWVRAHVERPLLIGPDAESEQWVLPVAEACGAPSIVLEKIRRGDRDVSVSAPDVAAYRDRTPVIVDDIISTARTMIETVHHVLAAGLPAPTCIGVHAVFADGAEAELRAAGAGAIVSCNTVPHVTNAICVFDAIADATRAMVDAQPSP